MAFLNACTVASMDVRGGLQNSSLSSTTGPGGGAVLGGGAIPVNKVTENFTAAQAQKKVDILMIDDNSASMDVNEGDLGSKFPSLVSALNGVDWQMGITTTDCGNGTWGICGDLLTISGLGSTYTGGNDLLSPLTPNLANAFNNTIVRPETVGCIGRNNCPDGDSTPLKATLNAMAKSTANNSGFFRDGAALAVVILTNADEDNVTPTAASTTAQQVMAEVNSLWGATKQFRVYTIGVLPGDTSCLAQQQATGLAAYATYPVALTNLTGGIAVSICSPNYSGALNQIGSGIQEAPIAITLAHAPKSQSVQVAFTPSSNAAWTLKGSTVTFASTLPVGTKISVTYEY
jgi:hypothetical protein